MTTLVAPVAGPMLGGYISDNCELAVDLLYQRADRRAVAVAVLAVSEAA